jgi:hypothetical protein
MYFGHICDLTLETIHSVSSRTMGAPFAAGGYLGARERDARELSRAVYDLSFRFGTKQNF